MEPSELLILATSVNLAIAISGVFLEGRIWTDVSQMRFGWMLKVVHSRTKNIAQQMEDYSILECFPNDRAMQPSESDKCCVLGNTK